MSTWRTLTCAVYVGKSYYHKNARIVDQKNFLLMLAAYEIDGRYPEERQTLLSRTPVHRFDEILEKASEMIQWCTQQIN